MELFRLHAYSISPRRTADGAAEPEGGAAQITAELRAVLAENISAARFDQRTLVDFEVDATTRTNEMRELVVQFGFGDGAKAKAAAVRIAKRLSEAMDMRSNEGLLVLAAAKDNSRRQVTVWTFPRDQAFRFRSSAAGAKIQVLTDVFSQTSKLRKAASFEGRNLRNEFLRGRVLDFQANQLAHDVANFWIKRFLQCTLSISGDSGTRMLAKTIRRAVESCSDVLDQEQLLASVMAVRRSPRKRWSLFDFANHYLSGTAKEKFLAAIPNPESRDAMFDFERDIFDDALKFRVFALESGVLVSSPINEVGRSVQVSEDGQRRLTCEGVVVAEKVRSRNV